MRGGVDEGQCGVQVGWAGMDMMSRAHVHVWEMCESVLLRLKSTADCWL